MHTALTPCKQPLCAGSPNSHRLCCFPFLFPSCQYYEMSYGLNIEMHKQVSVGGGGRISLGCLEGTERAPMAAVGRQQCEVALGRWHPRGDPRALGSRLRFARSVAGKRPRAEEMRAARALRAHPGAAAPRLQPCSELQGAPGAAHRLVPRKPSGIWCCVGGFWVLLVCRLPHGESSAGRSVLP